MSTRNVINVSEVDRFVDDLAQLTDCSELLRWLRSTARRWILKHYDRFKLVIREPATGALALVDPASNGVQPRRLEGAVPAWCHTALDRGDRVVWLRLGASLRKRARRAMAVLEADLRDGVLPSLERVDFPDAEARARKRRRAEYKQLLKARLRRGAIPVFRCDSSSTVVKLTRPENLVEEGCRMSHCAAEYRPDVAEGACEIYSLRDGAGKSRATLEVDRHGIVRQVKGFANGRVEPHYRSVLQEFIRARGYKVRDDRHNLVTWPDVLAADPKTLEHLLVDGGGLTWLRANRFADREAIPGSRTGLLLQTILANAARLPEPLLHAVFLALRPEPGCGVRVRPSCVFWVYGTTLRLSRVDLPLPILNLVHKRAFRRCRFKAEAREVYRNVEAALPGLALAGTGRLFAFGPARARDCWEADLLESPADMLLCSRIDVTELRTARHQALRQHLNRVRRRESGLRRRLCPGHVAVRRLLANPQADYVL